MTPYRDQAKLANMYIASNHAAPRLEHFFGGEAEIAKKACKTPSRSNDERGILQLPGNETEHHCFQGPMLPLIYMGPLQLIYDPDPSNAGRNTNVRRHATVREKHNCFSS